MVPRCGAKRTHLFSRKLRSRSRTEAENFQLLRRGAMVSSVSSQGNARDSVGERVQNRLKPIEMRVTSRREALPHR